MVMRKFKKTEDNGSNGLDGLSDDQVPTLKYGFLCH